MRARAGEAGAGTGRSLLSRIEVTQGVTAQDPGLTEQLAATLARPVEVADRARAALLVADWLGCVLGAMRGPLALQLADIVRAGPAGAASAIAVGARTPEAALLINAALGNVLEMDDVHRGAILHPGPVVIPVALAAAQAAGAEAVDFLDAVVRGYEATIRVGSALGTGHYRFWHPTSTAGAFGAAAAAASVQGLGPGQVADALGTAGSRTGGLWQMRHEPVPTKSIHNAEAARSGWLAARLAAAGLRGPRAILEGPQGLFAATAPGAPHAPLAAEAGEGWLIHGTSLKPWPACRHAHPAIDAMLDALAGAGPVEAGAIARIRVATYAEALRFCDRPHPVTELEARFSLQHALAAIACLGRPQPEHYLPAAFDLAQLRALRERVELVEDAGCSKRFPAHYGATVDIHLADGRCLSAARVDAWGDPECPMDAADVMAKARSLAAWGGVPADAAGGVLQAAEALAAGGTLAALTHALDKVPACA